MSKPQQLFAIVKDVRTGELRKIPIKPSSETCKLERGMTRTIEKATFFSRKYDHLDLRNLEKFNKSKDLT